MGFFQTSGILNRRGFFGGVAAAPSFVPTDLTGLIMWLDANDTSTLFDATSGGSTVTANDTAVARWEDKSTSAKHFKQTTLNNRPKLFTSSQNGKNVIRFDGTNDSMNIDSAFSGQTEATYFVALKVKNDPPLTTNTSGHPIGFLTGNVTNAGHYPFTDGNIYDNTLTTSRKSAGNPTPSLANFHIYNVEASNSVWTARVNKSQLFTTGTNTIGVGQTALGISISFYFDGDIGEFIAYSSILSSTDRGKVEDYLYAKWGI